MSNDITQLIIMLPAGFRPIPRARADWMVVILLDLVYEARVVSHKPVSRMIPPKTDRDEEIYARYIAGERAVYLAKDFGISVRRINKLIRRLQRRKGDQQE